MELSINIDGKEYTMEEAKKLYEELDKLFGGKVPIINYPPGVRDFNPLDNGIFYTSTGATISSKDK